MLYEARWSRPVHLGLAAASLALSVLGFAAAGVIPTGSEAQPAVGWSIVAACVGAATVFLMRALNRAPQVRADDRGIWTSKLGADAVPWRDITSVSTMNSGLQRIVRFQRAGSRRTFGINTTFYDQGLRQLLATIRQFRPDLRV